MEGNIKGQVREMIMNFGNMPLLHTLKLRDMMATSWLFPCNPYMKSSRYSLSFVFSRGHNLVNFERRGG
jgi:hypothetical protein